MLSHLLLQIDSALPNAQAATQAVASAEPAQEPLNLLALLIKGGIVMIPIALLSLIAVYIFAERLIALRRSSKVDSGFLSRIRDLVAAGNIDGARQLAIRTDSPYARIIEKGVRRIGLPMGEIDRAIENASSLELYKLERGMNILATVAGAAPMLGFLGTVVGMITAFYNISGAGTISISGISEGIYVKMITSAAGLVVGTFSYLGYNYLVAQIDKIMHRMESAAIDFMDILQEPANADVYERVR